MKTIQLVSAEQLRLVEADIPKIASDEVLVKVSYTGICGSDLHTYSGHNPYVTYPVVMGHELSGVIVEKGANCPASLQAGDKVAINPLISCGECSTCREGHLNICRNFKLYGREYAGGFAEYIKVRAGHLVKVPDTISMDVAAMAEPYAVGLHAVNESGIKLGDRVVVLGGGPIGMMTALAARAAGASKIIVSEISGYRLSLAEQLGFEAVNSKETDLKQHVLEVTDGLGADVVFETAATAVTASQLTEVIRPRGTAVLVGLYGRMTEVDLKAIVIRELDVKGSAIFSKREFEFALHHMPVEHMRQMVSHRLPIEATDEGFRTAKSAADAMKVLIEL